MVKKSKFGWRDCDYYCVCGTILHNTCISYVSKHFFTAKHLKRIDNIKKNIKEEPKIIKTKFEKTTITLTFD